MCTVVRYARPCAYGPSLLHKVDNSVTYGRATTVRIVDQRHGGNTHHCAHLLSGRLEGGMYLRVHLSGRLEGAYTPQGTPLREARGKHIAQGTPLREARGRHIAQYTPLREARGRHIAQYIPSQGG